MNGSREGGIHIRSWLARGAIVAVLVSACVLGSGGRQSVWVEDRSAQRAAFFLDDLSTGPGGWFIVGAHTTAHAGSDGLGTTAVRANVLGWGHEAGHVSECSPGSYDDTLYDVPSGASVRLLIEATGDPLLDDHRDVRGRVTEDAPLVNAGPPPRSLVARRPD
jgi:hypothetical protein